MRRIAYLVAGVAMLAGPALAQDDRSDVPASVLCALPSGELSPFELERCRRTLALVEDLARTVERANRGVEIVRPVRVVPERVVPERIGPTSAYR
jgi:hypothetical protein